MQELHDKFGSFWIIHAGEMFSWEVTGMRLSPGSSQQHLTLLAGGQGKGIYQGPTVRLEHMDGLRKP